MKALQKVIANTILDRQLQQHLGSKGFIISQLDASFDRQGFYSSNTGTFSVDVSEVFEVSNKFPAQMSRMSLCSTSQEI